ncbi:MAG: DUF547 domain-containing protein [Proteobacteria bacterium]|nr:DUF547 domain-containing protein [Pseudomonadota bacterium]
MQKWLLLLIGWSIGVAAEEPDWRLYGELLQQYVVEGEINQIAANLVDYPGLSEDPRFHQVVKDIRGFDVSQLEGKAEELAFYINAYNLLTLQLIIDHWPVESIRDIGGFFKGPWDNIMLENAAGRLTLDDIEHGIIRSHGEPRIHFAVNCASLSCPDLRREPYQAALLDDQLADQTRQFLLNTRKGARLDGNRLHVSKLFDWYSEDFEASGGVGPFIRQQLEPATGQVSFTEVSPDLRYSWRVNSQ